MKRRQQKVCTDCEIQSNSEKHAFPRSRMRRRDWQREECLA